MKVQSLQVISKFKKKLSDWKVKMNMNLSIIKCKVRNDLKLPSRIWNIFLIKQHFAHKLKIKKLRFDKKLRMFTKLVFFALLKGKNLMRTWKIL